jgi:hypothetical protein
VVKQGKDFFTKGTKGMLFEKSSDTKILEDTLRQVAVGDMATYENLSKAIGRDVRTFAIAALRTARHGLIKEGFVFGVEQNVGLVRLNSTEIVKSTEMDRKSVHRKVNRTLSKLSVAKYDELDDENKRKHVTMSAQMGALAMFSAKTATTKIESKVTGDSKVLPVGETLKLFGG